jgi:hypothetical protein
MIITPMSPQYPSSMVPGLFNSICNTDSKEEIVIIGVIKRKIKKDCYGW